MSAAAAVAAAAAAGRSSIATTNVTLSFSGSGHLLVYQLGACQTLLHYQQQQQQQSGNKRLQITDVVGASGGAIAATVVALTHQQQQLQQRSPQSSSSSFLEDYVHAFITQRGRGLQLLQELWPTMEQHDERTVQEQKQEDPDTSSFSSSSTLGLHIATTRCEDGTSQIFSFGAPDHHHNNMSYWTSSTTPQRTKRIMDCLQASCLIPPSFHPLDLVSSPSPYPDYEGYPLTTEDGIVGTQFYVDGGIATPAPTLVVALPSSSSSSSLGEAEPEDDQDHTRTTEKTSDPNPPSPQQRILITPIAGTSSQQTLRISPSFPPNGVVGFVGWYGRPQIQLRHDMGCYISWSNVKALQAASGNVSSSELQSWYQRGQDDAQQFLDKESLFSSFVGEKSNKKRTTNWIL
jgi:predicted acylesterase/phospholipase RssA